MNQYPPIFIIACHRSGTTMLRLMLTSHSKIAMPNELEVVEMVDKHFDASNIRANELPLFLKKMAKNGRFQDWQLPIASIENEAVAAGNNLTKSRLTAIFFENISKNVAPAKRYGEIKPLEMSAI